MYTFDNFALLVCMFLLATGHCRHLENIPKQTLRNLFKAMYDNCTDISLPSDELQLLLDRGSNDKTNKLNEYQDIKIELLNVEVSNPDGTFSKINKTKLYRLHADTGTLSIPPNSAQHQPKPDKSVDPAQVVKTEYSSTTTTEGVKPQSEKRILNTETFQSSTTKGVTLSSSRVHVIDTETTTQPPTTNKVKPRADPLTARIQAAITDTLHSTTTTGMNGLARVETTTKRLLKEKETKSLAQNAAHTIDFENNSQMIEKIRRLKKSASKPVVVKPPQNKADVLRRKCLLLMIGGVSNLPECTGNIPPWT